MEPYDIYLKLGEVGPNLFPLYGDRLRARMQEHGVDPQTPQYYTLAVSLDFEPDAASTARFAARDPYSNPARYDERFALMVEKGWMVPAGEGEYRLTGAGHQITHDVHAVMQDGLRAVEPLPAAELAQIKALLGRVVEAAANAPEPADKSGLLVNRRSDPGEDGPVLLNILQYVADLGSFRDDAHLAAWRPLGVSGPAWEALTFIWRDEAHTAAELTEKLPHRGHDEAAYQAALDELAARGWVQVADGRAAITESGAKQRQDVEDLTDRLYFAPWAALSADELAALGDGITRLLASLKAMQPEATGGD